MQKFDFDEMIVRRGTGCVKWDEPCHCPSEGRDVIPMWIADMDFAVAPAIQQAIRRRAEHPVFGYTHVGKDYYEAVVSWFHRRHQWDIRPEEIIYTTGVVPAMSVAIKALTMPGEKVLILSPDYNCFFSSIRNNGCEVAETALVRKEVKVKGGKPTADDASGSARTAYHFEVDWADFEQKCADEKTTVFLLCNPHNPTGRVWSPEELRRMNDICLRHGVRVVSDEIHCELVMPGHRFQPFAAVSEECRRNSVVLNSASKSFNIAGLMTANIVCADAETRRRLNRAININEVCDLNPFGPVALIAAYSESGDWIDALNEYLWGNYQALCRFFAERMPQCVVTEMEGTYLPWVDVSELLRESESGVEATPHSGNSGFTTVEQLCDYLVSEARVWLNPGTMYGPQTGRDFIRINIACPRRLMMEALERVAVALGK